MSKPRSQAIPTPRIVAVDQGSGLSRWVFILGALVVWSWLVFDFGRQRATEPLAVGSDTARQVLEARIAELKRERDALSSAPRGQAAEQAAVLALKAQIAALKTEVADLQATRDSLRGRQASGGGVLNVTDYALQPTGNDGHYRYRFTVQRNTEGTGRLEGWARLSVTGDQEGRQRSYSLSDLNADQLEAHKLGFRQFQQIEGELILPTDFVAQWLTIEFAPLNDAFPRVNLVYDWAPDDA